MEIEEDMTLLQESVLYPSTAFEDCDISLYSSTQSDMATEECDNCGDKAGLYCEDCKLPFCVQCSSLRHKNAKRSGHEIKTLSTEVIHNYPEGIILISISLK